MRFIHMADVHLGASPDAGYPWSETRKNEIWETFRTIIRDAGEEHADLLLIAGDLFHRQPEPEELKEVNYLFSSIPNTRVVLIAGNHDYIQPSSPYLDFQWAPNVACLFSKKCECVRFPEIQTEVYGFSYDRQEITEPLCDSLHPVKGRYFQILLAHGGDSRHIPLGKEQLQRSGFDYIALGHIHRPGALIRDKALFPGAPEPIDCADTGPHGYILGEYRKGHLTTEFVIRSKREYRVLELPVTEEDTTFSLRDRLEHLIEKEGWQHIYRVVLSGSRQPGLRFDLQRMREYGMVLDIEDRTAPAFHLDSLRRKYEGQMIGYYIESFEEHERSETEEKALRYGLEALLGTVQED